MAKLFGRKVTKGFIIGTSAVVVCSLGSGLLVSNMLNKRIVNEQQQYEEVIALKDSELNKYKLSSRQGYIVNVDRIEASTVIKEGDVLLTDIPDFFSPESVITNPDEIIGKTIKIGLTRNATVTKEMVYENGPLEDSVRKMELNYVFLPSRLTLNDTIDINLLFPNGEDYTVVSKKRMEDLDMASSMLFMNLNAEDRYLLDSALVDAYINNAEVYALPYADAEMQQKAVVSYIPNEAVLAVIKADPTIVDRARYAIANDIRKSMDARMEAFGANSAQRLRADLPQGSAVSKRQSTVGATVVGNTTAPATPADSSTPATDGATTTDDANAGYPEGYVPNDAAPTEGAGEIGDQ